MSRVVPLPQCSLPKSCTFLSSLSLVPNFPPIFCSLECPLLASGNVLIDHIIYVTYWSHLILSVLIQVVFWRTLWHRRCLLPVVKFCCVNIIPSVPHSHILFICCGRCTVLTADSHNSTGPSVHWPNSANSYVLLQRIQATRISTSDKVYMLGKVEKYACVIVVYAVAQLFEVRIYKPNNFDRTIFLESTQPLTKISARCISWGSKEERCRFFWLTALMWHNNL